MLLSAAMLALSAGVRADMHGGDAKKEPAVSMSGEIVDLSCYLTHGGKGKGHKKCAKACLLEKKASAGLLTAKGELFLLLPGSHDDDKSMGAVAEMAGEQALIKGRKVNNGGLKAILVDTVDKAGK